VSLGYLGLLLIVFEAGLSTNRSIILLTFGYGYSALQGLAAGAALCSTSLGTTLALLDPSLRQTRVGSVLISAALVDDIAGLVIAAIISHLSTSDSVPITWEMIVRPILVSSALPFARLFCVGSAGCCT